MNNYNQLTGINTDTQWIYDPTYVRQYTQDRYSKPLSVSDQLKNGWQGMGLDQKLNTIGNTVGTLMGAYNAYQANKLAKNQFAFSKDAWNRQWDAQKGLTNSQLEDRQQRRFNESNGRAMSVTEYMNKYGVK